MYHAIKYLKVENGIIALANVPRNYFDDSAEQIDISFKVTETCVLVSIRDLNIPIWDDMLEYMTKNRNITVYSINNLENNIESPVLGIEIPEHSMVEAKAIYNYIKQEKAAPKVSEQETTKQT